MFRGILGRGSTHVPSSGGGRCWALRGGSGGRAGPPTPRRETLQARTDYRLHGHAGLTCRLIGFDVLGHRLAFSPPFHPLTRIADSPARLPQQSPMEAASVSVPGGLPWYVPPLQKHLRVTRNFHSAGSPQAGPRSVEMTAPPPSQTVLVCAVCPRASPDRRSTGAILLARAGEQKLADLTGAAGASRLMTNP